MKNMVLLDWNGTLVDDMLIWHKSIGKIFEVHGLNPPSIGDWFRKLEETRSYPEVYHSLGINLSKEGLDQIYQEEYQKHLGEIRPTPGAIEALNALSSRGIVLGLVTVQLAPLFNPVFLRLGLAKYFKHVVVDIQKKAPVFSHLCGLERMGPRDCYSVGDSPSDIRNAKAASVKSIAFLTEHMPRDLILRAQPDFLMSHFAELPQLIGK